MYPRTENNLFIEGYLTVVRLFIRATAYFLQKLPLYTRSQF